MQKSDGQEPHSSDVYEQLKPELIIKHSGDFAVAISRETGVAIDGRSRSAVAQEFDTKYPDVDRDIYMMGSPTE